MDQFPLHVSLPSSLLQNEEKATSCDTLGMFVFCCCCCCCFFTFYFPFLAFVSAVHSSLNTTLLRSDSCQPAQQDVYHPGCLPPHPCPERKTTPGLSCKPDSSLTDHSRDPACSVPWPPHLHLVFTWGTSGTKATQ